MDDKACPTLKIPSKVEHQVHIKWGKPLIVKLLGLTLPYKVFVSRIHSKWNLRAKMAVIDIRNGISEILTLRKRSHLRGQQRGKPFLLKLVGTHDHKALLRDVSNLVDVPVYLANDLSSHALSIKVDSRLAARNEHHEGRQCSVRQIAKELLGNYNYSLFVVVEPWVVGLVWGSRFPWPRSYEVELEVAIVDKHLIRQVQHLIRGTEDMVNVNCTILVFIPKENDTPWKIHWFRPILFYNVGYKMLSKVLVGGCSSVYGEGVYLVVLPTFGMVEAKC
ncbi:hypothetical protein Ancab_016437 [Ancistrocladus abbreviatus]